MVNHRIKKYMVFREKESSEIVVKEWERVEHVCKPCWELKYCPYGSLVEDFPLYEDETRKATELGWYSRFVEDEGWIPCSKEDVGAVPDITRIFKEFGSLNKQSCNVYGHVCPVFFVNEPFTETKEVRRITRKPSRTMLLRIISLIN